MVSDSFDRVIATLKGTKGKMQVKEDENFF